MFLVILLKVAVAAQLYEAGLKSNYLLGYNMLVNPSFDSPVIPAGLDWSYYASIPGWSCQNDCEVVNITLACQYNGVKCSIEWIQGLDMDADAAFTNLSQTISIKEQSLYLMHIEWMAPFGNPIGKSMGIHFNQSRVYNFTVTSEIYSAQIQQFVINATAGNLTISLSMFGTSPDFYGITMSNLRFQQLIPIPFEEKIDQPLKQFINLVFYQNPTSIINRLPGNRIIWYTFTNFLSIFDRLKLYYFHRQNLSQNAYIFLSSVYSLEVVQGNIVQDFIEDCANESAICSSIDKHYKSLLEFLDSQHYYSDADFLTKNSNGVGFFANNLDFFYYQLPTILIFYLILNLAFKALFNLRVSLYLRKYSFYGILLLMVYEGNIENYSFYFFEETKTFFSKTIFQKLGKVFMVYFFFVTLVFAVGGLLYLKFHYRKLVKYFTEEYSKITPYLLMMQSLQKSIFPLLFGCIHSLLLENLALQTVILGIVEVTYFVVKLINLRALGVKFKVKVVLLWVTSLLRMGFIVTFYIYESLDKPALINTIHHDLIWLYLICWAMEFVYDVFNFLVEAISQIIKHCRCKENSLQRKTKQNNKAAISRQNFKHQQKKKIKVAFATKPHLQDINSHCKSAIRPQPIRNEPKAKEAQNRKGKNEELKEFIDYVVVMQLPEQKRSVSKKPKHKKSLHPKQQKSLGSKPAKIK